MNQLLIPEYIKAQTNLPLNSIRNVLNLLLEQDCTIPFITRYRKEMTGGMDEVQIGLIKQIHDRFVLTEKRKEFILKKIEELGKLTPGLKKEILNTNDLNILEDIYAPYKTKKKTKGQIAIEAGLAPLAELIKQSSTSTKEFLKNECPKFFNETIKNSDDASTGTVAILADEIVQNISLKESLRTIYKNHAQIVSNVKKKAAEIKDYEKYKDYFQFSQNIKQLRDPKASHRFLAMRRGMLQKVLKVDVEVDEASTINEISKFHPWLKTSKCNEICLEIIKAANKRLHASLELEMMSDLKIISDESAIGVFSTNLKALLLQPYLGPKTVLGIDPGIRTGCKLALINQSGKFLIDTVIYPHPPKNEKEKSIDLVSKIIEKFKVEYIAIGNGTYGRETLSLLKANIENIKSGNVKAMLVNEDGASIYSASEIARKEFPDKDPTVRGAISIARRFQDPLAELVKIDPKSLGVGQYQHDVSQALLKKSLETVVENCVNYVGVDLNTASAPLLSYISGIGPKVAQNIVKFREKKGGFTQRSQLLEVARFSDKVFEQAVGFLRIYDGKNPLDATFIHPESYSDIQSWCQKQKLEIIQLIQSNDFINKLQSDNELKSKLGDFTHADIVSSLKAPRQDPREEFKPMEFNDKITGIKDISIGAICPGIVTNITKFGAFVDIGIKENGLIHVSQMADKFIDDPFKVLKVGQVVKARVREVDLDRGRISLTLKSQSQGSEKHTKPQTKKATPKLKNSGFAALQKFKVK